MTNRLSQENSTYLLQHAHNPVDWYPWNEEALSRSRSENKPIFLSIGYSACHWCHVMAHESFEDPAVAEFLNQYFINIKVDREERPDLDSIYMNAVVAMTGQGGWPLSVFLTPDLNPFYGGTYFPPVPRYNMPSFSQLILSIQKAWQNDHEKINAAGEDFLTHLTSGKASVIHKNQHLSPEILESATKILIESYDWHYGGWGHAPKFPQPMTIDYLLNQSVKGNQNALAVASHALESMQRGGMYDVIGGGFHRYSVDSEWKIPHFEKMLYDNAQLSLAYLHGYLITGNESFRQTATETLDFILREMTHESGGFYSSLDADTDGVEGKTYLWSKDEIEQLITDTSDWELFNSIYELPTKGNFEGKIILQKKNSINNLANSLSIKPDLLTAKLKEIHSKLREARDNRTQPGVDNKIILSWNALTLRALSEAARYLDDQRYLLAAQQNANFLLNELLKNAVLYHAWRDGKAFQNAFLEDYAALIIALLALYQSDYQDHWYAVAKKLTDKMISLFYSSEGGFFDVPDKQKDLIYRPQDLLDNATPSGNALANLALIWMGSFTETASYPQIAENNYSNLSEQAARYPTAFAFSLIGIDLLLNPIKQIAVIIPGESPLTLEIQKAVWRKYAPYSFVAIGIENNIQNSPELLHHRSSIDNKPTFYICEKFTCKAPTTDLEILLDHFH